MPFRDPDEVLRARVAALEEELEQQRRVAHLEGRLGWPTSSDETDYGSWRRVEYRWSGTDASLAVSLQSPQAFQVTLKLDTHDETEAAARLREIEAQHQEEVEAARKRREEERRELAPPAP